MDLLAVNLDNVESWMHTGGYYVLFAVLFLCALGLPAPEEIPVFLAGFFVARGEMNVVTASICAWCGIIGGDMVLFLLGWRWGPNIHRAPLIGRHFTAARLLKMQTLFARWGLGVVAIGRLITGVRGLMCVAAGLVRYSFVKFFVTDGLMAIVSGGLFMLLGYWAGGGSRDLTLKQYYEQVVKPAESWIFGVTIALVVLAALYMLFWRRRHRGLLDAAMDKVVHKVVAHSPGHGDDTRTA
jgi:membrane protein DedA with SNARE-associated domain